MDSIPRKTKINKITIIRQWSIIDLVQIVRGSLKEGYDNINIKKLDDDQYRLTKWNSEG